MRFGMKRLNKRQIKKLTSPNYTRYESRTYAMYKSGYYEFLAVNFMYHKGVDKRKVLIKAENALKYGLKMSQLSMNEFIIKYSNPNNHFYNLPYLEGSTIEEAFDNLAYEAGYICDRYCEYRFYKFFYLIELCRYHLNEKTYSPIIFEKQEAVIFNAINIFNEEVNNVGGLDFFSAYYNTHLQELIEQNGNNYNVYDDEFYPTAYKAIEYVRHVYEYVRVLIHDDGNLNKFTLYQLVHSIRQAERILNQKFLPQVFN